MKVLLQYSLGKDSMIQLGRFLDNPDVTEVNLVTFKPLETPVVKYIFNMDKLKIFVHKLLGALGKQEKVKHIFSISYNEFSKKDNIITQTLNTEEYYLSSGENDSLLADEFLMKYCFSHGFKGIISDVYDTFNDDYKKYITTTAVVGGHYPDKSLFFKEILMPHVGNTYDNTEILNIFNENPGMIEGFQTIVIESPLYNGEVTMQDFENVIDTSKLDNKEEFIFAFKDSCLKDGVDSIFGILLK